METTLSLVPCLNDCGPYGQCLLLRRHGYLYAGCSCKAGKGQAWMPLNTPALCFPAVCLVGAHPSSAKAGEHPHRSRANASSPLLPHTPIPYAGTEATLEMVLPPDLDLPCPHLPTHIPYLSHTCPYLHYPCLSHISHLRASVPLLSMPIPYLTPAYTCLPLSHTCPYLLIPAPYCPTPAPHLPTPVLLMFPHLPIPIPHLPHTSPVPVSYLPDSCLPLPTLALPTYTCPTPVPACSWVRRGLLCRALREGMALRFRIPAPCPTSLASVT